MAVRVSPISRAAAIAIMALGVFTLIAGLTTGVEQSTVAGVAIIILGAVLYRLLFTFTRRLKREVDGMDPTGRPAAVPT